ncbi:UNVERIFIED_CONTAM: hypothetical protein K2H54_054312 [Gekko kuhli]
MGAVAAVATTQQAWEATMSLTGFRHIGQLLEAGHSQGQPDWELALRFWGYLVARINEYLWGAPAPLPLDGQLWERLTALRVPLQATWADRRRGSEWECRQALDIVARLLADVTACQRATPLPPWLTIGALAGTLEDAYDDLQREEGQERTTVMGLHAVEAWRHQRNIPQPNLRRPEWSTALHRVGSFLYQHLLKEKAARRNAVSLPDPGGLARDGGENGQRLPPLPAPRLAWVVEGTSAQPNPLSRSEAASGDGEGGGEGDSDAAHPDDADAMECDGEDGRHRRRAAEAEGWPEAETALKIWVYLASHVNAPMDERETVRPPTPDWDFWNRMGKGRRCIMEGGTERASGAASGDMRWAAAGTALSRQRSSGACATPRPWRSSRDALADEERMVAYNRVLRGKGNMEALCGHHLDAMAEAHRGDRHHFVARLRVVSLPPGVPEADVLLRSEIAYYEFGAAAHRVLTDNPASVLRDFQVQPLFRGDVRIVTTYMCYAEVPPEDLAQRLDREVCVLYGPEEVLDE